MAFPTTGILDAFNRANETPIGGNWSSGTYNGESGCNLAGNALSYVTGSGWTGNYWNAATYGNCEAHCSINQLNGGANNGFSLHWRLITPATASHDGYNFWANGASSIVIRVDNGVDTQLGASFSVTAAAGDAFGVESNGSTHTIYRKPSGGAWGSLASRTDATYASGYIGLELHDNENLIVDDFGGGEIVTATSVSRLALMGVG